MKQFFTLVVAFVCFAAMAQERSFSPNPALKDRKIKLNSNFHPQLKQNKASRATTTEFDINYSNNEDLYASENGLNSAGYSWQINTAFPNDSFWTFRDAAVIFDSLVENTDEYNSWKTKFYPKSKSQLNVDLVYATSLYVNTTGSNDTFICTTFKVPAGFKYTTAQATANFGGLTTGSGVNEDWNDALTVKIDTFISNGKDISGMVLDSIVQGTTTVYVIGFEPNVALAQGETFGSRIEFRGPIQNTFAILAGYSETCGDTLLAQQSIYPNSAGYINWIQQTSNFSGVFRDDVTFNIPACNRFYVQNWRMGAQVSNTIPFGAQIAASKTAGCPNSPVDLTANAYGSGEFTFEWSTSAGSLSSTTDELVTLTMPATGDAVVKLITTDSLGTSKDTASITVKNNAIGIAVNGGAPVQIACGTKATITTVVSGVFAGSKKYEWNIDTDVQLDTTTTSSAAGKMGNLLPGNYAVTVTNTVGCTGTTNFSVEYNNGVTNNVSFTLDDAVPGGTIQQCINRPITFTNTSSNQGTGWVPSWSFGDAALSTSGDLSPTFTYTSPGGVNVNLLMDSAGCVFAAPTKTVQILTTSASQCRYATGINEVSFDQNVSLSPNPTSGTVNLAVNGAEKNVRINIVNVIGSEVYSFNTSDVTASFSKQIDLNSLSNGTYLVKVQSAGKTAVKRLIIAK